MINGIEPNALTARYGIENNVKALECLENICKKRGFLVSKGEYDLERGARNLLDEFQTGKLGRISLEKP
jgi:ribosome biogenesis GTPase A